MSEALIQNLLYSANSELKIIIRRHTGTYRELSRMFVAAVQSAKEENSWIQAMMWQNHLNSLENDLGSLNELGTLLHNIRLKFDFQVLYRKIFRIKNKLQVPSLRAAQGILDRVTVSLRETIDELKEFLKIVATSADREFVINFVSILKEPLKNLNLSLSGLDKIKNFFSEIELMSIESGLELPKQDWTFINDVELRSILSRDYAELDVLLKAKTNKSVLVMCGSIMEAALVATLYGKEVEAKTKFMALYKTQKPIEDWRLQQLIAVAQEIGLLDDDSRRHADILRDYRNLIHPVVEVRRSTNLDEELVGAEIALLKRILRLLSQNSRQGISTP